MSFDTLTYEDALSLIPDRDENWFQANSKYAAGDHWQDGDGWSGPKLDSSHPLSGDSLSYIESIFVVEDTLNEIVERHANAITGSEAIWSVTGRQQAEDTAVVNQSLIDEATNLLKQWLTGRDIQKVLQGAITNMLWSNRGPIRVYVPSGQRNDAGEIPVSEMTDSIMRVFAEAPAPEQATVTEDSATKDEIGIYTYTENDDDIAELVYLDAESKEAERPLTVLRLTDGSEVTLDLSRRLTMYEIERPRLVTDAMVSKQKLLNHAGTAEQNNMSIAGFIARLFLNGQMPGDYERDVNGDIKEDSSGRPVFVADPMTWGPEAVNFIVGVTTSDESGNERIANPSYVREEPAAPDTFIKTKTDASRSMLRRSYQAHVFLAESASASGEARLRARGDFESSLTKTKQVTDRAITWLLETVLTMAATFSGQPGYFDEVRVAADVQVDIGILTPSEQRTAAEMYTLGLISKKTAMSMIGVADVETELEQMEAEAPASAGSDGVGDQGAGNETGQG